MLFDVVKLQKGGDVAIRPSAGVESARPHQRMMSGQEDGANLEP